MATDLLDTVVVTDLDNTNAINNFLSGLEDTIEELEELTHEHLIKRLARLERVVYQQQRMLAFLVTDLGLLSKRCNEVGNCYNNVS